MKSYDKDNKILWDIESTLLNDISYKLCINDTNKLNIDLCNRNEDKRCSYITYSDFIKNKYLHNKYIDKAKIIIRKDKINKIMNR